MKKILELKGIGTNSNAIHHFEFDSDDINYSCNRFKNSVMSYLDINKYYKQSDISFPMGRQKFRIESGIKHENVSYEFICEFNYPSKPEFHLTVVTINSKRF